MHRQVTDINYNVRQRLDLFLVEQPQQPLVVCLHGGGFISGDKSDIRCTQSVQLLNDAGFNCAAISYSLASAENRFAMWPRNLFDLADAIAWLHDRASNFEYDFGRLGLLGFSAGCCLANLYIQGGKRIFEHFAYSTPVFQVQALAGFYGPYDFSVRQRERRSDDDQVNLLHSPAYWLRNGDARDAAPVLHIQGDRDEVVRPDQHHAFQKDYRERGHDFEAIIVEGFGHSFAPQDTNNAGLSVNLGIAVSGFFNSKLG
jgi:acetyl esterase/lipase